MPLITGTNKSESLNGAEGDDTIIGAQGNDTIKGWAGNDLIDGGAGNDSVLAGEGNDTMIGGRGDLLYGEGGDDLITFVGDEPTGIGTTFNGGVGIDTLRLDFSVCFDSVISSAFGLGSGSIAGISYAGIEHLSMIGGTASDVLIAGDGNDTLTGGRGNDRLDGKAGLNVFVGGGSRDIALIDLTATIAGLVVAFTGEDTVIGGSSFSGIEALGLKAGSGNDSIDVDEAKGASEIFGGDGNDTLSGINGWADSLDGGAGEDRIEFGRRDTVRGGLGNDTFLFAEEDPNGVSTTLDGDDGIDTLILDFSTAFDSVTSSHNAGFGSIEGLSYSDFDRLIFTGGSASDTLIGGGGGDTLSGGGGNDRLDGQGGFNKLVGGANRDIGLIDLSGNIGSPITVTFKAGKGTIAGTKFIEIESLGLKAGGGDDWINVTKAQGGSELYGNGGNDTLTGAANWGDTLEGGLGNDLIHFHHGDIVRGGDGADDLRIAQAPNGKSTTVSGHGGVQTDGLDTLTVDFSDAVANINSNNGNTGSGAIGGINYSFIEFLLLIGGSGKDTLAGGQGSDTLRGGDGADSLTGASDTDYLTGGDGADRLSGGLGVEGDFFIYNLLSDSTVDGLERDTIADFTVSDRVDLSALDAVAGTLEDDAFVFIGSGPLSGVAGELRYVTTGSGVTGSTTVLADVDGDGVEDFAIDFTGALALVAEQFIL